eukprot:4024052-Amphidinium_carterae.1
MCSLCAHGHCSEADWRQHRQSLRVVQEICTSYPWSSPKAPQSEHESDLRAGRSATSRALGSQSRQKAKHQQLPTTYDSAKRRHFPLRFGPSHHDG